MQTVGAQLSEASWNVRQTASGLSVSLFWPSNPGNGVVAANHSSNRVSRSKRRRLRRIKSVVRRKSDVPPLIRSEDSVSCQKPVTLISAHDGVDKSTQDYPGSTF